MHQITLCDTDPFRIMIFKTVGYAGDRITPAADTVFLLQEVRMILKAPAFLKVRHDPHLALRYAAAAKQYRVDLILRDKGSLHLWYSIQQRISTYSILQA